MFENKKLLEKYYLIARVFYLDPCERCFLLMSLNNRIVTCLKVIKWQNEKNFFVHYVIVLFHFWILNFHQTVFSISVKCHFIIYGSKNKILGTELKKIMNKIFNFYEIDKLFILWIRVESENCYFLFFSWNQIILLLSSKISIFLPQDYQGTGISIPNKFRLVI